MLAALITAVAILFLIAYRAYGRFVERRMEIDPHRPVPSQELRDGVDYVPTPNMILFGHHFSSIAGAGPIVGPIVAGLAFGWLPALLWIVVGSVFVGGVHDFATLVASIRHRGRSIAEIAQRYMSRAVYRSFLIFIWISLVYVLIVFMDLVASGFAPAQESLAHAGGAVATTSLSYIALAIVFGLLTYKLHLRPGYGAAIFVPLVFLMLLAGWKFPLTPDHLPHLLSTPKKTWYLILLVYCFFASCLPVWILLQPRDFLSSFLLYSCLLGGAAGILLGGFRGLTPVQYSAFLTWKDPHLGLIYPALFITVACGAVSGFHSLVASGTTAKQLASEPSARPVAYGSMLVEGFLAVIALATVMFLSTRPQEISPVGIFARGIGTFLSALGIPREAGLAFGLLAISTFLLTTLDTTTRLCRFIFQEFTGLWNMTGRITGTVAALGVTAAVIFQQLRAPDGTWIPAWKAIWPAFGTTNQLMAALALIVVYTWLRRKGRRAGFILLPTVFMAVTTVTSLVQLAVRNLKPAANQLVGWVSVAMIFMAALVIASAVRDILRPAGQSS